MNKPKRVAGDKPKIRLGREGFSRTEDRQNTAVRTLECTNLYRD